MDLRQSPKTTGCISLAQNSMIRDNLQELPRFKDPRLTKVPSNLLISSIKDMEVYQCIPPLTLFLKNWISQPVFFDLPMAICPL